MKTRTWSVNWLLNKMRRRIFTFSQNISFGLDGHKTCCWIFQIFLFRRQSALASHMAYFLVHSLASSVYLSYENRVEQLAKGSDRVQIVQMDAYPVCLEYSSNFRHQGIVRVGITQKRTDRQQHCGRKETRVNIQSNMHKIRIKACRTL